jgi:hypothetical protein
MTVTDTTRTAPPARRHPGQVTGTAIGAALILIRLVVPMLPLFSGHSLAQASAVCSSGLGQIAAAFSPRLASDCSSITGVMTGLNIAAIAGVVMVLGFGFTLWRARR